jgi:hypothetical protein
VTRRLLHVLRSKQMILVRSHVPCYFPAILPLFSFFHIAWLDVVCVCLSFVKIQQSVDEGMKELADKYKLPFLA